MLLAIEEGRTMSRKVADLSAERATTAAEAAADAAQQAVGLMERLTGRAGVLAPRGAPAVPEQPVASVGPQAGGRFSLAALRRLPEQRAEATAAQAVGEPTGGVSEKLKRAAAAANERINEWSEGRYGLTMEQPKAEKKAEKRAEKLEKRRTPCSVRKAAARAQKAAEQAEKASQASWLPWMIGLSLGLLAGLFGVAYWQRRRLQEVWGQTSQRVQQAGEEVRQRFEALRSSQQSSQAGAASGQAGQQVGGTGSVAFRSLGSAASVADLDESVNGLAESKMP